MSLAKELTDELNMQCFDDCKTPYDKKEWGVDFGRVVFVLHLLRDRGLLKEEDDK